VGEALALDCAGALDGVANAEERLVGAVDARRVADDAYQGKGVVRGGDAPQVATGSAQKLLRKVCGNTDRGFWITLENALRSLAEVLAAGVLKGWIDALDRRC